MGRYDKKGIVEARGRYAKREVDTAKYKLSGRLYDVMVPRLVTLSELEMEYLPENTVRKDRFGVETNDAYTPVHVKISILTMAEYFDDGYSLRLVYPKDLKELYHDIEEYIDKKGNGLKYSPNGKVLQTEQLELLDRFAGSILELNRDIALIGSIKPLMFVPKNTKLVNRTNNTVVAPKRRVEGSPIKAPLASGRFLGRKK